MDNKQQINKHSKLFVKTSNNNLTIKSLDEKPNFLIKTQKESSPEKNNNNIYIANSEEMSHSDANINTNVSKEDTKSKLTKIFNFYSKYSSKENDYFLHQQSLLKILKAAKLIDEKFFKTSEVDLILKKLLNHNNKINLKSFMDFLVYIARKFDTENFELNQKESFNNFIRNFIDPLLAKIENLSSSFCEDNISNNSGILINYPINQNNNFIDSILKSFEFDYKIKAIINNIAFSLKEVYLIYFIFEVKNKVDKKRLAEVSFQNLIEFAKDFEIYPFLCNLNHLVMTSDFLLNIKEVEIKQTTKSQHSFLLIEKDIGQYFKFSKFSAFIVYLSLICFNKYVPNASNNNISNQEKLLMFLEKLENSKGFQNLERKTCRPHTSKLTLIPDKDIVGLINPTLNSSSCNLEEDCLNQGGNKSFNQLNLKKIREYNLKCLNNENYELRSLLLVNKETFNKIETISNTLVDIFLFYSKIGDKLNNSRLTLTSFSKFLKDCDVLKENRPSTHRENDTQNNQTNYNKLSPLQNTGKKISFAGNFNQDLKITANDVSLLFHTLTGVKNFDNSDKIRLQFDKNKGILKDFDNCITIPIIEKTNLLSTSKNVALKMDFYLFVKSFELIALKLYPDKSLDTAMNMFLDKDIKKLINSKDLVIDKTVFTNLLNSLQTDEIIELLNDIHPIILPHYENYSGPNKLLTFDQFFDFYKDFLIFPDLINLMKMKNLFFTLSDIFISEIRQKQQEKSLLNDNDFESNLTTKILNSKCINYDLFLDSLTITANTIKSNEQYSDLEKVLYLIERMNQSGGINKSQKRSGNTFSSIKDFSNFFFKLKDKYPDFYKGKILGLGNKPNPLSFNGIFD